MRDSGYMSDSRLTNYLEKQIQEGLIQSMGLSPRDILVHEMAMRQTPLSQDKRLHCPVCQKPVDSKFDSQEWAWTLSHKGEEFTLYATDYKADNIAHAIEWLRSLDHTLSKEARAFSGYFRRAA